LKGGKDSPIQAGMFSIGARKTVTWDFPGGPEGFPKNRRIPSPEGQEMPIFFA
jgi:hypothetical protein